MKIEEKKLRTWGSAALLLGILPLVFLVLRDHHGFDQANIILFDLSIACMVAGSLLKFVELFKVYRRAIKMIEAGHSVSIG